MDSLTSLLNAPSVVYLSLPVISPDFSCDFANFSCDFANFLMAAQASLGVAVFLVVIFFSPNVRLVFQ